MSGKASQAKAAKAMKEALLKWVCMTHASNAPLNRMALREKALQLVFSYGLTGFKCSEAWLTVFLKRHGFSSGLTECCGPVFENYRIWIDLIRPLFMEFSYEDQFHVDELMMYTDFLPPSTSKSGDGSEAGSECQMYPLDMPRGITCTLLLASNSSGTEKLRPLICAPYPLKDSPKNCIYNCENDSKITDEIFGDWLVNLNREMAANHRRIVVLMSRSRVGALRYAELTHIVPLFFPNDFPAHLRPLRRDVFHYVKMIYRTKCVERMCAGSPLTRPEEIVETLIQAWNQVPRELIIASFQRTKFREDDTLLTIQCPSWDSLGIDMPFSRFITFDDDISDKPVLHFDRAVALTLNKSKYSFKDSESEDTSKLNDVDDQSDSSRDLESSLKRPSDDSINVSSELLDHGRKDVTSDCCEMSKIPGTSIGDCEQFFSARDTDEGQEEVEKKAVKDEDKIEDVLNDVMDAMLDRTKSCSPTRDTSTPISKDYDRGLMNRVYPSPERTSTLQLCSALVAEQCFEEVSKTLENKLMDLEKSCCGSYTETPRKQLDYFDVTPSTSKEGLESFVLPVLDDKLEAENIFQGKIEALNIGSGNSSEILMTQEKTRGDGVDSRICKSKETDIKHDIEHDRDDEPPEKKQKIESNWAERYEKQLVFGPDNLEPCELRVQAGMMQIDQSTSAIEKKCIFTISNSTTDPSGSFKQ